MDAASPLFQDDDSPPPSGVRIRVPTAPAPLLVLVSPLPVAPPAPHAHRRVLVEVATEVFFEVYGLIRTLTPLQGPWLRLGQPQIGAAALTVAIWQSGRCHEGAREGAPRPIRKVLRERWPELVPGRRAMDCLVGLMVDSLVSTRIAGSRRPA